MSLNHAYGFPKTCSRCEEETCFYCGTLLSRRHEHDHFPVPKRAGGTETVAACVNCHDLKDRTPLAAWPVAATLDAVRGLISVFPPVPLRILDQPEQLLTWLFETTAARPDVHLTPTWARISTPTRLVIAKLLFGHLDSLAARGRSAAPAPAESSAD